MLRTRLKTKRIVKEGQETKVIIKQTENVKVTVSQEVLIRNTAENKDVITGLEMEQAPELY